MPESGTFGHEDTARSGFDDRWFATLLLDLAAYIKMSLDAAGVDMDELNAAQREYPGEHTPASTTLGVSHLTTPWARLEVDIVASVRPERS
jgi:enamine deaminase RidA (YjgF/YER057c/UK114 family)